MSGKNRFIARATSFEENLISLGANAAVDAARLGAEVMEQTIQTSGTGYKGHEGRIESGGMLRDVDYDKRATAGESRTNRTSRSARFGWISGWEDYYKYQELGFVNRLKRVANSGGPPGYTYGMKAYANGYYAAQERLRANIQGITKKAWFRK